jgi:putative DNA primase/helicase
LDFKFEPEARAPRFERFLAELWPEDASARDAVVELFGLCLTRETKCQSAFLFVGPPRGGRGTIGRVLKGFVGKGAFVGATFDNFGTRFGMQNWIGKSVAVFADAKLEGVPKGVLSTIAARLQNVTGEDEIEIDQKNVGPAQETLTVRILVFANKLPGFVDDSGALAERFKCWAMTIKFREEEQGNRIES